MKLLENRYFRVFFIYLNIKLIAMKNFSFLFTFFSFICTTNAQIVNIPDPNFKAKLISNGVDTNTDGEIQESEALSVTGLYLDNANINSLEGIQSFTNVTSLWCSYNPLTEINLCGTGVAVLFCYDNPNLTTINLKNNVISATVWQEPPFPPFWAQNLPSLQYICADATEMYEAQMYFTTANSNTITFSSDCDITDCSNTLNSSDNRDDFMVSVYPNPVSTKLNIKLPQNINLKTICIYNIIGQLVQVDVNPSETIDVSGLKTGSYVIKITSDRGMMSRKFIKN